MILTNKKAAYIAKFAAIWFVWLCNNVQTVAPKRVPPLEFNNQTRSVSKFHQLDGGLPLELSNMMGVRIENLSTYSFEIGVLLDLVSKELNNLIGVIMSFF